MIGAFLCIFISVMSTAMFLLFIKSCKETHWGPFSDDDEI